MFDGKEEKEVTPESHASFFAEHLLVSEYFGLKLNWILERDGLRMRIQGRTMNQPISDKTYRKRRARRGPVSKVTRRSHFPCGTDGQ